MGTLALINNIIDENNNNNTIRLLRIYCINMITGAGLQ